MCALRACSLALLLTLLGTLPSPSIAVHGQLRPLRQAWNPDRASQDTTEQTVRVRNLPAFSVHSGAHSAQDAHRAAATMRMAAAAIKSKAEHTTAAAAATASTSSAEGGGDWWVKEPPAWMPPPPEWGPIPPTLFEDFYRPTRHTPMSTPNYGSLYPENWQQKSSPDQYRYNQGQPAAAGPNGAAMLGFIEVAKQYTASRSTAGPATPRQFPHAAPAAPATAAADFSSLGLPTEYARQQRAEEEASRPWQRPLPAHVQAAVNSGRGAFVARPDWSPNDRQQWNVRATRRQQPRFRQVLSQKEGYARFAEQLGRAQVSAHMEVTMHTWAGAKYEPLAGGEYLPASCKTCVFVLERLKRGTQTLIPTICKEVQLKFPLQYRQCLQVQKVLALRASDVRYWLWQGCYEEEVYGSKEWIKPCPSHVICQQLMDARNHPFCKAHKPQDPFKQAGEQTYVS